MLLKQMAISYAGTLENYELFQAVTEASPHLYSNDFLIYNDSVSSLHERNIAQITKLKGLLQTGKLKENALLFNTWNTFYPSYILHHHHNVFLKIAPSYKSASLGAYFTTTLSTSFKETSNFKPKIAHDLVVMPDHLHYYSSVTSPYLTHCCFIATRNDRDVMCVVKLTNKKGVFIPKVKDFGATISSDYLVVGYNLNGMLPEQVIELSLLKEELDLAYTDFYLSLRDLHKALHITISYVSMRKQFKTIDNSKEERTILSYQAVAKRIISAFGLFVALSDLNAKIKVTRSTAALSGVLSSAHQLILQEVIHLRECCGGYGFLQASGHPGCIERLCFRAAFATLQIPTQELIQRVHYYSHSADLQKYYLNIFNEKTPTNYTDLFCVFVTVCSNPNQQGFEREFLIQAAIQAMHGVEEFSRHDAHNLHANLVEYLIVNYILQNAKYVHIVKDKVAYFGILKQHRNKMLISIAKDIPTLHQTLEVGYLRNVIVGRKDSQDFYRQMLAVSKANKRNSQQYIDYVAQPIREMVGDSRARL